MRKPRIVERVESGELTRNPIDAMRARAAARAAEREKRKANEPARKAQARARYAERNARREALEAESRVRNAAARAEREAAERAEQTKPVPAVRNFVPEPESEGLSAQRTHEFLTETARVHRARIARMKRKGAAARAELLRELDDESE